MNSKLTFLAITTVLIALTTAWFLNAYERVEKEQRSPASAKARANNLLGFQMYLDAIAVPNQRIIAMNTSTQLPATTATILFVALPQLNENQREDLLSWVAAGGHLALQQSHSYSWNGSLLQALGLADSVDTYRDNTILLREAEEKSVAEKETPSDESRPDSSAAENSNEDTANAKTAEDTFAQALVNDWSYNVTRNGAKIGEVVQPVLELKFAQSERPVKWTMEIQGSDALNPQTGRYAMGFNYGQGFITVINSLKSVQYDNFRKADNPFLLLTALRTHRAIGKLWLVNSVSRPSIWSLIWNNAAHLVLWLALGVLFFFWWAGQRFGRILPAPFQGRREYSEHIAASARYLWKHQHKDSLLADTLSSLNHKINRRFPHLRDASPARRHQFLESVLGDDIKLYDAVHSPPDELNKTKFLEQIKAIQKLWNKI